MAVLALMRTMANTLFKGDLAEVSFGKETGLRVNGVNSGTNWVHTSTTGNTSLLTLDGDLYWTSSPGSDDELLIPDNILVGCTMRIEGAIGYTADNYATTKRTYYITANDSAACTITVQPALKTATGVASDVGDNLLIDFYQCPTFDAGMSNANQRVKTDQFIGLLNSFNLPEPDIDVRKQHVVGLGRDVNVITSGRETLTGGSIQLNAHTIRWLKYALGGHTAKSDGEFTWISADNTSVGDSQLGIKDATQLYRIQQLGGAGVDDVTAISTNTYTGASLSAIGTAATNVLVGGKTVTDTAAELTATANINLTHYAETKASTPGGASTDTGGLWKTLSSTGAVLVGSYQTITNAKLIGVADIDTGAIARAQVEHMVLYVLPGIKADVAAGDTRLKVGTSMVGATKFATGDYVQLYDYNVFTIPGQDVAVASRQIYKHEIRRIIAVGSATSGDAGYIYIEEPFIFDHTSGTATTDWGKVGIEKLTYTGSYQRGEAHIDATTKELKNGITHTLFGHTVLPSFTIEQSFRTKDAIPDSDQLLRLYSGCKVSEAKVNADTEGELKIDVSYDAARHYTATTNTMLPTRMFDNYAESATNRKVSGIVIDGEKPYLFQDISVEVFGRPVLRGTEFSLSISNNTEARWFIRGYEGSSTDNDQVAHGATQTPLDITESKREYTFTFKAMVEDERLWEELRTRRHHRNTNDITVVMTKNGSAATRQTATITLEDYTIMKADHQIPDDKGPVIAEVELVVRHMKVTENSPYYIL